MSIYKERGIESFLKRDFKNALFNFSLALKEEPDCYELRVYAILSDMAVEKEEEALTLFEYFRNSQREGKKENIKVFDALIDTLSLDISELQNVLQEQSFKIKLEEENGIAFSDFISLVEKEGDFRRVFEDIMFSTKVVISNKDDFVMFLNMLVDNGFEEMSLGYIESAISLFPSDERIQHLARRLMK